MIPEAGLLTFSVDKAPYSILMMVSIVSAYRLMARRGLRTVFFSVQGFLHERGELGSISSQKEVLRQNLAPLVVGYIFTSHTYYNASYAAPLSRLCGFAHLDKV